VNENLLYNLKNNER